MTKHAPCAGCEQLDHDIDSQSPALALVRSALSAKLCAELKRPHAATRHAREAIAAAQQLQTYLSPARARIDPWDEGGHDDQLDELVHTVHEHASVADFTIENVAPGEDDET
jgi:hypothetical protein